MAGALSSLTRLSYVFTACFLVAGFATGTVQAAPYNSAGLAGHQAVYDIRLSSSKMGSQVIDVRGKMMYSAKPSCEGWIVDHQFRLKYEYTDNPAMDVDTKFASFESYDGRSLNFSSARHSNGELAEELRGKASVDSSKGVARYSIPVDLTYNLSEGTLFPITHTIRLIEAAKAGQKTFHATVFDGSDEEGPVDINAVIGRKISGKTKSLKDVDPALADVPGWNIRMAVFPQNDEQASADYELSMSLLQNGVIKEMSVDYRDFSITQKLVALKKIEADKCGE